MFKIPFPFQNSEGEGSNGTSESDAAEGTWLTQPEEQVTSLQPLRNHQSQEAADSFFDFDMEPESPGSPIDECEYSRLIETTTNTPHPTDLAPESGYVCASPVSAEGSVESQSSSSDGPYFDPDTSDAEQRSMATDYHDCIGSYKKDGAIATIFENVHIGALKMSEGSHKARTPPVVLTNGIGSVHAALASDNEEGDSCSDSLPPSQSTTTGATMTSSSSNGSENTDKSDSTVTGLSAHSNSTILDETEENDVAQSKFLSCREQGIDDIQQDDLEALSALVTGQCNGHQEEEEEEEKERVELKANGHLPCEYEPRHEVEVSTDEVDRSESKTDAEVDQEIELQNERIILECLRVIDATPEASPEPESRADEAEDGEGKLKVETGLEDTDGDGEGDLADDRPQRVRRCSSLKTGKTPPGTPGRKKIVRFADALGLDLAAVRTFMDEMPKIPKSAYEDLDLPELGEVSVSLGPRVDKVLMPLFQQPGSLAGFLDVVRDRQVSLENAAVTDPVTMTISGIARVRNLDFHKSVYIRYSTDSWRTYSDLQASYVENSCDGFSDKFSFTVFGNALQVGERIELAVRFHCKGQILWDNNCGTNYCFQCLPVKNPARPAVTISAEIQVDQWHGASFY